MILNPKDNYITIKVDKDKKIIGEYRGKHNTPPHSQALVISEWTQIIVTLGHFQGMQGGYKRIGSSIIINGKEESKLLTLVDPNLGGNPLQDTAEITIGATDSESFEGSIGFIEIYSAGAVLQTSKHH